MKPKKSRTISILTTSFPRHDGDFAGQFILNSAREIAKLGKEIEIITPITPNAEQLSLPPEIRLNRFKGYFTQFTQTLTRGGGVLNQLKQNRWSIVQLPFLLLAFLTTALRSASKSNLIHAYWFPAGIVAVITGLIKSRPVVVTLWGSDILFLKIPILSHLIKFLLGRANAIICENQHFKVQLVKLGFKKEKISIIPNGIDIDSFKPRDKVTARTTLNLPLNKLIILAVGSLTKNKGHNYLIQALSLILNTKDDIHLYIVGEGNERASLNKEIQRLNLNAKITLVGQVTNETIPAWLNAADIFALPSLHEGTPNSLLEAMASGLPVVASVTGGIPDIIDDKRSLVTPGSSKELEEKLVLLLESPEAREQLGKNARLKLEADYGSWKTHAERVNAIYEKFVRADHHDANEKP